MASKKSFQKGWNKVPIGSRAEVFKALMSALGLKCRTSLYPRINGTCEPKVSAAEAIEKVFAGYGITEIWDDEQ